MKAILKDEGRIPRGTLLKKAATGKRREEALRAMDEIAERVGARARAAGLLTDEDVARFINEP